MVPENPKATRASFVDLGYFFEVAAWGHDVVRASCECATEQEQQTVKSPFVRRSCWIHWHQGQEEPLYHDSLLDFDLRNAEHCSACLDLDGFVGDLIVDLAKRRAVFLPEFESPQAESHEYRYSGLVAGACGRGLGYLK